jgi:cyclin-dependent kinase-like
VLGSLTQDQQESFNKNPRFLGLKFPADVTKLETLEKKYTGKLSKNALSLMTGLLKMDPSERFTGEQALAHPYFDDIREPSDRTPLANQTNDNDIDLSALIAPA